MTIYERLLDLGYSDADIRETEHIGPRTFQVVVADTPDGVPLVGISYRCDYRFEEEDGVNKLHEAIRGEDVNTWRMVPSAQMKVATFRAMNDGGSLIISTDVILNDPPVWGEDIVHSTTGWSNTHGSRAAADFPDREGVIRNATNPDTYDSWWSSQLPYTQGMNTELRWKKVPELKELAKAAGISPLPKVKDELIAALQAVDTPEHPNVWPGWFHYGKTLVLRADRGIAWHVLGMLADAAEAGELAIGGGSQAFSTGIGLYDARDVGPKLEAERGESAAWQKARADELEPVAEELAKRGHSWYFLGNPRETEDGVQYWLNGRSVRDNHGWFQPAGWYTLEELLAEKFLEGAR